jgi:hypothetical protein
MQISCRPVSINDSVAVNGHGDSSLSGSNNFAEDYVQKRKFATKSAEYATVLTRKRDINKLRKGKFYGFAASVTSTGTVPCTLNIIILVNRLI